VPNSMGSSVAALSYKATLLCLNTVLAHVLTNVYRGHTHTHRHTQCIAQCSHTVIESIRFLELYVYVGTPTSRRIESCLTWRSINGVACSYRNETR
jgi:hypothetical protein